MKKEKKIKFLKGIELFKGLDEKDFELLAENIEERSYSEGSYLFKENAPRENLYIIYSGEVKLSKKTVTETTKELAFFSTGDFLGEGSLNEDSPHSTSACVVLPATVFSIKKEFFKQYGETSIKVFSNITRVISRRMRHVNNRLVNKAAQYESGKTRLEHDLLGEREVPYEYMYGVQTLRALENFNISGILLNFFPDLIKSLAQVKLAAATTNYELDLLEKRQYSAIKQACEEIIRGKYHNHFIVDMIQGGAGTSTNMNANEVIANRALEIMGYEKGQYEYCHPNAHVNLSQSTNDVYPTAIKIALIKSNEALIVILKKLIKAFRNKANEFESTIKMGRTQLQDAVPMTLGQEFEAYSVTLDEEVQRLDENANLFLEVHMGGTAIGTGINTKPGYSDRVIDHLRRITGLDVKKSYNLVEATQDTGAFVMFSSAVKRLAIKLSKISNDLRLLSSGPRAGLNEINLPPMQPGSSIMPGKVNPVIPEVINQIAFKVIGNDNTITMAAEAGQLELNVMEPVIVQSLFESIEMLKNGMSTLRSRCIEGITANYQKCRSMVENSIGLVTALNPVLGYETCTKLATEALERNIGVYDLVIEKKLLTKEKLNELLKPENMINTERKEK